MPHIADMRVQAWAPTREGCIAEAVLGTVECFVDTAAARVTGNYACRFPGSSDPDLLAAVLDEVICLLDVEGRVTVDVELEPDDAGVDARFATVAAADLPKVGAVPKGVSRQHLSLARSPRGWSCSVTLDV